MICNHKSCEISEEYDEHFDPTEDDPKFWFDCIKGNLIWLQAIPDDADKQELLDCLSNIIDNTDHVIYGITWLNGKRKQLDLFNNA